MNNPFGEHRVVSILGLHQNEWGKLEEGRVNMSMKRKSGSPTFWCGGVMVFLTLTLTACGGGSATSVKQAVATAASIEPLPDDDDDCPQGGVLVKTGIDENGNGLLDDNEVDATQKVCHGEDGADGLSAAVDVKSEPFGENCPYGGLRIDSGLDRNGNGRLDDDEIEDTEYFCSQPDGRVGWEPGNLLYRQDAPAMAMNATGEALLVTRYRSTEDRNLIETRRYVPNAGWARYSLPINGVYDMAGTPTDIRAALDEQGNAVVVWAQDSDGDSNKELYSSAHQKGSDAWTRIVRVDDGTRDYLPGYALDLNKAGQGLLVWPQGGKLQARYRPGAASGWGTDVQIVATQPAGGSLNNPKVVMSDDGWGMAVWVSVGPVDSDRLQEVTVYASRFDPASDTLWSEPVALSPTTKAGRGSGLTLFPPAYKVYPQVRLDGLGNVHVVWIQRDHLSEDEVRESVLYYARFDVASGTWGMAETVVSQTGKAFQPRLTLDVNAAGDMAILWWGVYQEETYPVFIKRSAGETSWAAPVNLVSGRISEYDRRLYLSLGDDGSMVAMWIDDTGLIAKRYDAVAGWLPVEELLERPYFGNFATLSVTRRDARGNFFVAAGWKEASASLNDLMANRTWVQRFVVTP